MTEHRHDPESRDQRRHRAEARRGDKPGGESALTVEEMRGLVHELRESQVELEMQNEELARAKAELEERVAERTEQIAAADTQLELEIDDRRKGERALRQAEARYRALFEEAPAMYVMTRPAERGPVIEDCNAAFLTTLGYERDEVVGKSLRGFYAAESRQELEEGGYAQALRDELFPVERRLLCRDGGVVDTLLVAHPLPGAGGEATGTRAMFLDISERKHQEAQRRALGGLREAIWNMTDSEDIGGVLDALRQGFQELGVVYTACGVNLLDQGDGPAAVRTYTVLPGGDWEGPIRGSHPGEPTLMRMWQGQRTLYRRDLQAEDPFGEAAWLQSAGWQVRSVIDVPFKEGTLALRSDTPNAFTDDQIESMEALAEVLSAGFRRQHDLAALERRARESEALAAAIESVAAAGDQVAVFETVVREAARLVEGERCALFLHDPDQGALVPQAQVGHDWMAYQHIRIPPGEGVSGKVLQTGQPYAAVSQEPDVTIPTATSEQEELYRQAPEGQRLGAAGAVPLRLEGEVIGTLSVGTSRQRVTAADLELLQRLADHATVAVARTRYLDRLEGQRSEVEERDRLLAAFGRIGETMLSSLELDRILDRLIDELLAAGIFRSLMIALVDEERHCVEVVRSRHRYMADGTAVPPKAQDNSDVVGAVYDLDDENITADVARRGVLTVTEEWDERFDRRFSSRENSQGQVAYFIPVRQQDRVVAVLATGSRSDEKAQYLRQIEVMGPLLGQVAIALAHARLYGEVHAGQVRLRELSRRLLQVQEEERRLLATELHDEVGQTLTGLKLMLEANARMTPEIRGDRNREAVRMVSELLDQVRQLSLDLRPPMVEDLGLAAAMEWLARRFETQTQLTVELQCTGLEREMSLETQMTAYRLVQEGLTNVARHAKVEAATVRVWVEDEALWTMVMDEGVGMPGDSGHQGTGLSGMRERASLLGGSLQVESAPGQGTRIMATLPVDVSSESGELEGSLEARPNGGSH